MQKDFWKSDWFTGVAISLALALVSGLSQWNERLENAVYDAAVRTSSAKPSPDIAVIAIDDQSIANIGRWPWPRDVQAKLINILTQAKPKAIGYTPFLTEPQKEAGLDYINQLTTLYASSSFRTSSDPALQEEALKFETLLKAADEKLNGDRWLAASFANAGNVMVGAITEHSGIESDKKLPAFVSRNEVDAAGVAQLPPAIVVSRFDPPIPAIAEAAAGIGVLEEMGDADGVIRAHSPLLAYKGQIFPSMALLLAARAQGIAPNAIRVQNMRRISMGKLALSLNQNGQIRPQFYNNKPFVVDSSYDVLAGKIQPGKYQDKIVLIGATATGLGDTLATPVNSVTSPVIVLAHTLSSLLQNQYYTEPDFAPYATAVAYTLIALYLILLLPRLHAAPAAGITLALATLLIGAHFYLMAQHLWIQLTLPLTLLLLGHAALTTKRFFMTEKGKLKSESESAESNKMLGLAFQGQGQLDMAFDKFRKVPLDDAMMDVFYNLALDFERKRQFNKAHAAFQHMASYNANFRDLQDRLKRAKAMEETVFIGAGNPGGTLLLQDGSVEKPMLGRYQVEKELGKGAMGVVYEGRDPKIGRIVAIKTMALSNEFDESELEEVRARFFREAETAGRLSHPHIVTIFDAGEEHDLAYIAMEFLKGRDLTSYTKPGQLLPLAKSMKIIAKVADALNYAHAQHVVHRDIKPANIMYEPETGEIKVTDFGIARITDSSRTRTGMVLGTPAFMSPEQLGGKKIDGRSDIFSLGSTFYQLVTGTLPFKGDSMAELMYQIANEQPKPVESYVPNMPHCIGRIINKMMMKSPEDRYQSGIEVARALVACGKDIAASIKAKT